MRRVLRLLVSPLIACLLAGCPTDVSTIRIKCDPTKPTADQCSSGEICGEDSFCRTKPDCTGRTVFCGGVCASLDSFENCGACGTLCNAGEVCLTDAQDATRNACKAYCSPGLDACSGVCVNKTNDRFNCGACGNACPSGQACQGSACVVNCLAAPIPLTNCNATCVDLTTDRNNCGVCGTACVSGQSCQSGQCQVDCLAGQTNCGGTCVDKQTDANNCSSCGNKCQAGQACVAGACQLDCQTGLKACSVSGVNTCVDPQTDRRNCGDCGNAAGTPSHICAAGEICSGGACVPNCPSSETSCNGSCVNLQSDPANCGTCGNPCNAGETCSAGHCALSCQQGLSICDVNVAGSPVPTCVDLNSDARFCGACTNAACPSGQVCSSGACQVSCQTGLSKCGSSCVNVATDPNHCGVTADGCGNPCQQGELCLSGVCTPSCLAGSIACGSPATCVNTQTDNQNCGHCSSPCGAGTACSGGHCVQTCGANSKLCGPSGSQTCKDITSDPNNCGDCGSVAPANVCATGQVCSNGTCTTKCGGNLGYCASSGLCKDLQSDAKNCGTCDNKCQAGEICQSGGCVPACSSNQALCSGVCTDTAFDPNNCGGCGSAAAANICGPYANATGVCAGGNCAAICDLNFGDCKNGLADGCETNLATDSANCGACNNACSAPDDAVGKCTAGKCQGFTCQPGYGNCDGASSNGCEALLASDAANCGACGAACTGVNPFCRTSGSGAGATTACSVAPPLGLQQNVSTAALQAAGFRICYQELYSVTGTSIPSVMTNCTPVAGNDVVVGCRAAGSDTILLAAHGLFADVFADTGAGNGVLTSTAYGVSFYFNAGGTSSMGFAPSGATVNRAPCDSAGSASDGFAAGSGNQRLCWITQGNTFGSGSRCGALDALGGSPAYERIILGEVSGPYLRSRGFECKGRP